MVEEMDVMVLGNNILDCECFHPINWMSSKVDCIVRHG
jgi:hypothetical protein